MIHRLPLSTAEKAVLARLHDFCGQRNTAFPGQERLAADVSLKPRQLRTHLRSLAAAGFIRITRRKRESSIHQIDWTRVETASQDRQPVADQDGRQERHCTADQESVQDRQRNAGQRSVQRVEKDRKSGARLPVKANQDRQFKVVKTGSGLPIEHNKNTTTVNRTEEDRQCIAGQEIRRRGKASRTAPKIRREDFADIDRGIEVISGLLISGALTDLHRVSALALWIRLGRQLADGAEIKSPSGVFIAAIQDRRWGDCSEADDIAAHAAWKAHDRADSASRPPLGISLLRAAEPAYADDELEEAYA